MLENYEIVKAIDNFTQRLDEIKKAINIEEVKQELKENEEKMNDANFWLNAELSKKVLKEVKSAKEKIEVTQSLNSKIEELSFYFDMHKNGEENLGDDIEALIKDIEKSLSDFEIKMLLSKEYDDSDAIIDMHPGAGGTESQDWCSMLYRMYQRYAEREGYSIDLIDYQDGEEAGIKSVSFIVRGDKAYGKLKCEKGVHRLVRISPFDSNARRHTSFCAVSVIPELNQDIDIEIKPEDIKVDTYRSSGAGGQYINKTESAIRITHIKTGIVVSCQTQRSQFQNREFAMRVLKAKLYQLEKQSQEKKIKEISGEASENSFGSQIRSYVFHPYSLVKDHRTGFENYNVNAVMDGDLEGFINAYLKSPYNN
ncbi:MAG: peptide chain release factor 2 [Bacilli bacterium]|nr:peptide chain release factor 2 [Bacilli bacterium]